MEQISEANYTLKSLLSSKEWLIEEFTFNKNKLNVYETLFTVGNGYLGTRGSLEEGHLSGLQGTYINGLFDHFDSFIIDLVNAPDWTEFSVWVENEKLSLHTCQILDYYRALDMKQGFLYRTTRFKDNKGRITNYENIRYASLSQENFFESKVIITPENYSGKIEVEGPIDGRVFNLDLEPAYKEKPEFISDVKWDKWTKSKHLSQIDTGKLNQGIYLKMKTLDRPHHLFYSSCLTVINSESTIRYKFDYEYASQIAEFTVEQGQSYHLEKLVCIFTSRDVKKEKLDASGIQLLKVNLKRNFSDRFSEHKKAWNKKWEDCDIVIKGDAKSNKVIRFNIYHLLITANPNDDKANIGAKSLSGEGYKGHIFWDTEIFLLPFYIYTQPDTARALLMYRYNTLDGAREYAKEGGFEGARFPWESADTGHEVTPPWTADGKERIWAGEREIHITSAVTFGIISYVTNTNDKVFLIDYGLEILLETARFWNSRLEYNKIEDRYELTKVEGPDEFHELVNNSVYTNWLAKWNLEQSANYYYLIKESYPKVVEELIRTIKISENDIQNWKAKASKIYIPFDSKKGLVEQFEGYFNLKEVPVTEWDENNMPKYPNGYNHYNCHKTTLVKQPDVLMLMYMLPGEFTDDIKKLNYEFYEPRTLHKSSLSPSIHAIMGIETENINKALQYFERSAYVDLLDNQGNTDWGMHIASAGGTWQIIVNGFAGLRVKHNQLVFKPWLPEEWVEIRFKIKWKNSPLNITLHQNEIEFEWENQLKEELPIKIMNKEYLLQPWEKVRIKYA